MSLIEERRRRIVTTHVGSLPRPESLSAKLFARMTKQPVDAQAFSDELRASVRAIVERQAALGIDVVSDGEFSKISFQYYATERLGGIEPIAPKSGHRVTRETKSFPTFYRDGSQRPSRSPPSTATARIPARSRRVSPAPARSATPARRSSPPISPTSRPRAPAASTRSCPRSRPRAASA